MVKTNWDTEELIENWTLLPTELQIEPPTQGRVERLVRSAIAQHEADFCQHNSLCI